MYDLTDYHTIRNLLKQYRLWAQKRLGQHFLIDKEVLNLIIKTADITPQEYITEIGPGHGVLTVELLKNKAIVDAVEIDQKIIPVLKETTRKINKDLVIHNQHVLGYQQKDFPYKLIANIPYHLTSPILRKFLVDTDQPPKLIVFLVQKEVAEKICDPKKNSLLSLFVKVFGQAEIIKIVPASSFFPPPKVQSAILKIKTFDQPQISVDKQQFFSMVKRGSTAPRKMLKNVLEGNFQKKPAEISVILNKLNIPINARAENLSIENWENLTNCFYKKRQ